jgi:hypothetical protein
VEKLNKVVDILEALGFTITGSIFLFREGLLTREPKDVDVVIKNKEQLKPLLDGGKFTFYEKVDEVYFDKADKLVRLAYDDIKVDFFIKEDDSYTKDRELHIKEILKYKFEIMLARYDFSKNNIFLGININYIEDTFNKHYKDIQHIFSARLEVKR